MLERRRRVDQALYAVVMEAYLHGVSTRKVDDLVKALGVDTGISKSEVSRICADLDEEVAAFRGRSLKADAYPYVFLDATYCKARVNRRVVSQAVVVATAVRADGNREVLGFDVGDSEDGAFWTSVPALVEGPRAARGTAGHLRRPRRTQVRDRRRVHRRRWQRCRVHFLRNVLARVPKGNAEMVAAAIRTIFAQPDAEHVRSQLEMVATMLGRQFPAVEAMLRDAATGPARLHRLPASRTGGRSGPPTPWSGSTGRSNAAPTSSASSPTEALLRLAGAVLVEIHDEWAVTDRRYLSEGSMKLLTAPKEVAPTAELTA